MRRLPRYGYAERQATEGVGIWLFSTSFWWQLRHRGLWSALRSWLAYIIQGENLWGRCSGEHMAVIIGDELWEASWPSVRRLPAAEALTRGPRVFQFAVISAPAPEVALLRSWLMNVEGAPYDVWLFSNRAVAALARLVALLSGKQIPPVPIVDLQGEARFICYELAARALAKLGVPVADVATFGPPDLWRLVERGYLREPVMVVPET